MPPVPDPREDDAADRLREMVAVGMAFKRKDPDVHMALGAHENRNQKTPGCVSLINHIPGAPGVDPHHFMLAAVRASPGTHPGCDLGSASVITELFLLKFLEIQSTLQRHLLCR